MDILRAKKNKRLYKQQYSVTKNNSATTFRVAGWFLILGGIGNVLVLVLAKTNHEVMANRDYLQSAIVAVVFGAMGIYSIAHGTKRLREERELRKWNQLSTKQKAASLAADLKSKKRGWYLNQYDKESDFFVFAALKPKNMNELGGGLHVLTTPADVKSLLEKGKIVNNRLATLILAEFEAK